MKVADYINERDPKTYGKTIRVLESKTHRNLGQWYDKMNVDREVKAVKVAQKYLFIFV